MLTSSCLKLMLVFVIFLFLLKNNTISKMQEERKPKCCNFWFWKAVLMILAFFRRFWSGFSGKKIFAKNSMDFSRFEPSSNLGRKLRLRLFRFVVVVQKISVGLKRLYFVIPARFFIKSWLIRPPRLELSTDAENTKKYCRNKKLDVIFFWGVLERPPCTVTR